MVRVRGIMTDLVYRDRRCNKCGHKWTVGDSLELPFNTPASAPDTSATPVKAETGTEVRPEPETPAGAKDYDLGDGWEPDPGSTIPF